MEYHSGMLHSGHKGHGQVRIQSHLVQSRSASSPVQTPTAIKKKHKHKHNTQTRQKQHDKIYTRRNPATEEKEKKKRKRTGKQNKQTHATDNSPRTIPPSAHTYIHTKKTLYNDPLGLRQVALARTVGALQTHAAPALGEALQTLLGDHVAAWEHHWGIQLGCLVFGYWTHEDGVELVSRRERNLGLQGCVSWSVVGGRGRVG